MLYILVANVIPRVADGKSHVTGLKNREQTWTQMITSWDIS